MTTLAHNKATSLGYTKKINVSSCEYEMDVFVKPDADLDGTFKAFDVECNAWVNVNGWLFEISENEFEGETVCINLS